MRTNLENPRIFEARMTGIRHSNVVVAISATQVIPSDGPTVWILDGGLGDRSVRLPALTTDKQIVLANVGTTNNLNVTDSAGGALVAIPPQAMGIFFGGTSRWVWATDNFSSDIVATTLVTISGAVLTTDINVQVNGAGAVVLTLPLSAAWITNAGRQGLPLTIADMSGAAASNNITINPAGAETLSGLSNVVITTNYGSYRLQPKATGSGWIVL